MKEKPYQFELYRLQILTSDQESFDFVGKSIRNDEDIINVLSHAAYEKFDLERETPRAVYIWSIRDFINFKYSDISKQPVIRLSLARSTKSQKGRVVSEDTIKDGVSEANPPLANDIHIWFYLDRHLVAVEFNSLILNSQSWKEVLETILLNASVDLKYYSTIKFGEKPKKSAIVQLFDSFTKLTRLKVHLILPNPEFDRFTKKLHDEMLNGEIREYIQDMKNPSGLNKKKRRYHTLLQKWQKTGTRRVILPLKVYAMERRKEL